MRATEALRSAMALRQVWRTFLDATLSEFEKQSIAAIKSDGDSASMVIYGEKLPITMTTAFKEDGEPLGKLTVWTDNHCRPDSRAYEPLYIRYFDAGGRLYKNPEDAQSAMQMDDACRTRMIADCAEAFIDGRKA